MLCPVELGVKDGLSLPKNDPIPSGVQRLEGVEGGLARFESGVSML